MKIFITVKNWARSTDPRICVMRFNQDHTLDELYPDVVPTVRLELTLEAGPQLRIWIPLARRTPLFVFGPDASKPAEVDLEATFPSFDNADELIGALDKVRSDFLAYYSVRGSRRLRRIMTHAAMDMKR